MCSLLIPKGQEKPDHMMGTKVALLYSGEVDISDSFLARSAAFSLYCASYYYIMSLFTNLPEMLRWSAGAVFGVAAVSGFLYFLVDYVPTPRWLDKKAQLVGQMNPQEVTGVECPYEYLRKIYGKHHWAPFVHKLSPGLRDYDHFKYLMVLEIMDSIHLCLMLVDDVRSYFRGPILALLC